MGPRERGLGQEEVTEAEEEIEETDGEEKEEDEPKEKEESEEGRRPRMVRRVVKVSKQEREEHEVTHTPFRAWCRHCVRGRARNTSHVKGDTEGKEEHVPRISMDYFFLSKDDEKAHRNPLVVMVDEDTGRSMREQWVEKDWGLNTTWIG